MSENRAGALGRCLQRIEVAMAALDEIGDSRAGGMARELVEAVLDLHGIALARMIVIMQGVDESSSDSLAADEHVAAALLLHGLHPEEAETRLRKKITAMRPHWGARGFRVELESVDGASAKARVLWSGNVLDRRAALGDIEAALIDAAPDLDDISLQEFDRTPHSLEAAAVLLT